MNKIEEEAINTYNNNMLYLMKEHPKLAKDLNNLDLAIQNNLHVPQYDLEYIDDNFDIKDLTSGKYMYSKKSSDFAKETANQISYDKINGSIEGFSIYDINKLNIENPEDIKYREDIYTLMTYHVNNVSPTQKMKKIHKFIFIGVGLGLHIMQIDKKINASDYLIVEDNLEIFKLSLFTTEYYNIAKTSRLIFSILEDNITFTSTFDSFLNNNFAYNRFLKYVHINNHSNEKIRLIQSSIANQNFVTFPYKQRLDMSIRPLNYIHNGYKFLNLSKHIESDFFSNKPLLLVAAGPSFKKNINWLKENHTKFIIIAVSAAIKTLHKYDIKPDIVTHIDGANSNCPFFEGFNIKEYLKDSIFVLAAMAPKSIINILPQKQIYLFENITSFHKNYAVPTTECVGSFSLLLSLLLNAGDTYLLGLDLALNQETGETHSGEHTKNAKIEILDSRKLSKKTNLINTTLPVKGNFKDIVYTNPLMHGSIKALDRVVPDIIRDKQKIYNLSEGCKISNASALKVDGIDINKFGIIDKSQLSSSIHSIFNKSSCETLNKDDIESLKIEFEVILRIKTYIDNFKNKPSYRDSNLYLSDLVNLLVNIIEEDKENIYMLTEVYYDYFKYTLAILEDFFNNEETKEIKQHLKKFNKMVLTGLYHIQNSYEEAFKSFIDNKL